MNLREEKIMNQYRAKLRQLNDLELKDEWERVRKRLNPNCIERQQEERMEKPIKRPPEERPVCMKCDCCRPVKRPNTLRYLYYCVHKQAKKYSPGYSKYGKTFICHGKPGGVPEPNIATCPRWCPKMKEGDNE